ncbi:DNA polymerase V subunit UmuC, partial [Escherichia coli]
MFGLADVNSFYASCEALFRPDLRGKPIVVLSNNDGCVIARNAGAKALGIKMGVPWFQIKNQSYREKVHVFSSNYALYHSLSQRVMSALEEITPRVEQYSIDEMFLDLTGIDSCEDFEHFGRRLKAHALNTVGLPIGVGIGQT